MTVGKAVDADSVREVGLEASLATESWWERLLQSELNEKQILAQ
jgi:hypothetical protein